jgi:hypothetical protein
MSAGDPECGSLLDLALSVTDAVGPLLSDAAQRQASLTSAQGMQLLAGASQLLTVRVTILHRWGCQHALHQRLCCVAEPVDASYTADLTQRCTAGG